MNEIGTKHIAISRRYWWWQHKKMLRDGVGYLVSGGLRPRAIKWIPVDNGPGALTEIPAGWLPAPGRFARENDPRL